jgi:hypothetical protein
MNSFLYDKETTEYRMRFEHFSCWRSVLRREILRMRTGEQSVSIQRARSPQGSRHIRNGNHAEMETLQARMQN